MGNVRKERFVTAVFDRYYSRLRLLQHLVWSLAAIVASFVAVFLIPNHGRISSDLEIFLHIPYLLQMVLSLLLITGMFMIFVVVYVVVNFLGGHILNFTVGWSYRWIPLRFLTFAYFGVGIVAILVSVFSVEFSRSGSIGPLSLLDSFYLVASILTTIGANDISPYSNASKILIILINAATLLLVTFVFQRISQDVSLSIDPKRFKKQFGDYFSQVDNYLRGSSHSREEKERIWRYFMEKFDFDSPDGLHRPILTGMTEILRATAPKKARKTA